MLASDCQAGRFVNIPENIAHIAGGLLFEALTVASELKAADEFLSVDTFVAAATSLSKLANNKNSKQVVDFIKKCDLAKCWTISNFSF